MKLDYIENINQAGDSIIRLFDFDKKEATSLKNIIADELLLKGRSIHLDKLNFIEAMNCSLKLIVGNSLGIEKENANSFSCSLSLNDYKKMIDLIDPFTKDSKGYQWLYDLNCKIDFLLSPSGQW